MSPLETLELFPDLKICRIINGMWQVAGGHGVIDSKSAISEMVKYHDSGFTTWDMADIYGPAEEFLGEFRRQLEKKDLGKSVAFTKFVPNPGPMTKSIVEHYIDESRKRMNVESIDLLQFHWWDYNDSSYLDALKNLEHLRDEGKIRHLGLTNFNTEKMDVIISNGINLVSNQVQYSILDQRPEIKMVPFCQENKIKLFSYGTLLGGFLSEKYLGVSEPTRIEMDTSSLQKYKNMIDIWGGWNLFQELLTVLNEVAQKHDASIANISMRFILDKPEVSGVIIGARLGISEHRCDNLKVFGISLDDSDYSKIKSVTTKANDLFNVIGDCGDEYR
ncbi:MAG: aldo/keto reductase [Nitrosopumilus sp.]|nr:aldo/keto reductase [Nitrosopumilus sp.]MDH3737391.1 aldo/keto reductase [Nitrosopumilus sp.]MDH3823607.1 aldo/keto reductase [Nitrosopumilus sp.]MDH3834553.1 aldo/keto reductase [Nitrosopumilus sp.]